MIYTSYNYECFLRIFAFSGDDLKATAKKVFALRIEAGFQPASLAAMRAPSTTA